DDEAELAGVMAHEIAHVALRQGTRAMTKEQITNIVLIPVVVATPVPAGPLRLAEPLTLLKFSRAFEAEADYFGVQYMYKTGYDPNAMVAFLEKIKALEKRKPGTLAK